MNIKSCIFKYYAEVSGKHAVEETNVRDATQARLSDVWKIMRMNNDNAGLSHIYTINMYHTTSRILVNGKSHECFILNDLPGIIDLLRDQLPYAAKLNTILKQALQTARQSSCHKTKGSDDEHISTSNNCGKSRILTKSTRSHAIKNSSCTNVQRHGHYNQSIFGV